MSDEHPGYDTIEELRQQWEDGDVADLGAAVKFLLKETTGLQELRELWKPDRLYVNRDGSVSIDAGSPLLRLLDRVLQFDQIPGMPGLV